MNGFAANLDDKYMYEFCTKRCTKKDCPRDVTCFYAHSKVMSRRVPRLQHSGLFNYIPEHCPWYKKKNKCRFGDSCFRSHGWLEVIFHPLLYKTKLCESTHENGICRSYGIYCAKAHKRSEMRNLVKIYGEGWKYHYDTSRREVFQKVLGGFGPRDFTNRGGYFKTIRAALPATPKTKEFMEVGLDGTSDHVCGSSSPVCSTESLSHGEFSDSLAGQTWGQAPPESIFNFDSGDEQVGDYTDLYSAKLAELKIREKLTSIKKRPSLPDVFSWHPTPKKSAKAALSPDTPSDGFSFFSNSKEMDTVNDAAINYDMSINNAIFSDGQAWGDYSDVNDDSETGA